MAAVQSLNLPFANLIDRASPARTFQCHSQGVSGSRQNVWQCVNPANVVWVESICENVWCGTDIEGVVVVVGLLIPRSQPDGRGFTKIHSRYVYFSVIVGGRATAVGLRVVPSRLVSLARCCRRAFGLPPICLSIFRLR